MELKRNEQSDGFPFRNPDSLRGSHNENVYYCKCGSWRYIGQPCAICAKLEGK